MTIRINVNSLKNAVGTVFLLAAAFFVCSTFISMRSVFADPIVTANNVVNPSSRISPRVLSATSRSNVARTTTTPRTASRTTTTPRANTTRTVSSRSITPTRLSTSSTRNVTSRSGAQNRTVSNRAVRARTATTQSRVGVTGNVMSGSRASGVQGSTYKYLASALYTGSYSNIIDSSTGLIAADAYSNCMESYYACMDEICTARSDTKGRCSCAGRAIRFLEAEQQLESANEELIKLSGQLSLLIATKGKGDDLSAAFSLTDAEKVMNCVSYKEKVMTGEVDESDWYKEHPTVTDDKGTIQTSGQPKYCSSDGNSFGFDIANIDGSSSDILAQFKAWSEAKDLAKEYEQDTNNMITKYMNLENLVNSTVGITTDTNEKALKLDSLANKWGYDLFQHAHNNVCGRVLDSCFNGIYEACGTPGTVTVDGTTVRVKCGNGETSNCPFNYNSNVSVKKESNTSTGEIVLKDSSSMSSSLTSMSNCFGYSTTTTTTSSRSGEVVSTDPYYSVRGPVADARRSIINKYLLDANAACDVYGAALTKTAQNINYQKIAAEQALQAKRLEFKQEEEATVLADATAAITNFNECISEIWDCYDQYEDEENWTTARIKAYCSQVAQVPHCYETMICSPLQTQLTAVIDLQDNAKCKYSNDYTQNTCRNVVTISEILYGVNGSTDTDLSFNDLVENGSKTLSSAAIRNLCLNQSIGDKNEDWSLRSWKKSVNFSIKYYDGDTELTGITPSVYNSGQELPRTFTVSPTPTKQGYTFAGWCEDIELQNCSTSITINKGAVGTKAFYAKWLQNN